MRSYDAVIVGAGHNGLVAALYLQRAGWSTLVLERNARIGGAVQRGEITRPGFVHDLWSTNQNLFVGSPVYKELRADLKRHGLSYCVSSKPYANAFPDGTSLRVHKDARQTRELLRQHDERDAAGWQRLFEEYQAFVASLLPLYAMPLPSVQAGWALLNAARAVGVRELAELAQILLSSTRELGEAYFASREARALIATWGMHLDFGPDVAGGAMFPFLEAYTDMQEGMAIARGGASAMVDALAALLKEHGGEIRTEAEVRRILTDGDTVSGVELADGEQIGASRAVIANLAPTVLFGRLLAGQHLPEPFRRAVARYRYGPGTMMVHLALGGKPRWAAGPELDDFAYVHIAPYVEELAESYTQAMNGYLPADPLLIVGQTTAVDPSRAPDGQHILWIQVRALPATIRGDAAAERRIDGGDWDTIKEAYAERVLDKLERYAPGVHELILDRVVYSPADLERHNPNLVGGDSVAGSHHPRQNFLFRPVPGWSTYKMPLNGLYMVGAATWPGAGTNATSGYLCAQQLLHPHPLRDRVLAGGAAAGGVTLAAGAAALGRWWARSRQR